VQTSVGKVMVSICESEGTLLVEFLERGTTINSEQHVQTLGKLNQQMQRFRPNRKMNQILNPPYHTKLAHSDIHLLGRLKDAFRGHQFADDNKVKHSMHKQSQCFSNQLIQPSYSISHKGENVF
jgi:Transposase.